MALVPLLLLACVSVVAGQTLYVFDLRYALTLPDPRDSYEHTQVAAAVGGVVNRGGPVLYLLWTDADVYWLSYLQSNWLRNRTVVSVPDIASLVSRFYSNAFSGVVLYDPLVPSTSLVASTAAGVEGLLPLCYRPTSGSLYQQLVLNGPRLPVRLSLVGLFNGSVTGSSKCDAYVWAVKRYISSGLCDARSMGYYIDYYWTRVAKNYSIPWTMSTVANHDFFISKKGFFWDLDTPNDDPNQPLGTDYDTLLTILRAAYTQTQGSHVIHIGGFTPWNFKYVGWKHQGVETEWQTVKITTAFNAFLDADACCFNGMANAAFYHHYKLQSHYPQNPHPTVAQLQALGFVDSTGKKVVPHTYFMFYAGDYDSASWVYNVLKLNWDDPARGSVPIGWAVDPNLQSRFPVAFDYMLKSLTPNDRLITGDSGVGYISPTQLFVPRQVSKLPAADELWYNFSAPLYQQFSITFTGFLINGACGNMTTQAESLYARLGPDGMVEQTGYSPTGGIHIQDGAPVFQEWDLPDDPNAAAQVILSFYKKGVTQFQVYRSILKSPTYHKQIVSALQNAAGGDIVVVEPLVLSLLAKIYFGA